MSAPTEAAPASGRVVSVDALRGFTMFWIIGGKPLVLALIAVVAAIYATTIPQWIDVQKDHAVWEGFTAWDMVMPLFLFIVGVAMPLAFRKRRQEGQGILDMYWRVFRRVVALWVLGMFVQGHLLDFHRSPVAFFSNTLQAIAVGYLVSAILILHFPLVVQILVTLLLLGGYYLLMLHVPFGGHEVPTLTEELNLARYIDETLLGHFRDLDAQTYTWILTSMTFTATVLLGVFGGRLLGSSLSGLTKVVWLVVLGGVCLALGWFWSGWMEDYFGITVLGAWRFPCIKHIWSSSMVLWAGGWSYLLLALFYLLIDVIGLRFLGWFFVVIGINSIFAYVVWHLVSFPTIARHLVGGWAEYVAELEGTWGLPKATWQVIAQAFVPVAAFLIFWLILLYMYRNRTFVKV